MSYQQKYQKNASHFVTLLTELIRKKNSRKDGKKIKENKCMEITIGNISKNQ